MILIFIKIWKEWQKWLISSKSLFGELLKATGVGIMKETGKSSHSSLADSATLDKDNENHCLGNRGWAVPSWTNCQHQLKIDALKPL